MKTTRLTSDENLRYAILDGLMTDERTRSAGIRVGVLHGIAHLAGKVESVEARCAAEEAAQRVSGVRGVVNRIEAPGAPEPGRTIHINL